MPFTRPLLAGGTDAGKLPGPTVYAVLEHDAGKDITLEAIHVTHEGAKANLEAAPGRERFIQTMEVQQ